MDYYLVIWKLTKLSYNTDTQTGKKNEKWYFLNNKTYTLSMEFRDHGLWYTCSLIHIVPDHIASFTHVHMRHIVHDTHSPWYTWSLTHIVPDTHSPWHTWSLTHIVPATHSPWHTWSRIHIVTDTHSLCYTFSWNSFTDLTSTSEKCT